MVKKLSNKIIITELADDIPLQEVIDNDAHRLTVSIDESHRAAYLDFSTREAMYDFARFLLHRAIYSRSDMVEILPLLWEGKLEAPNGVRLDPKSARLFIFFPEMDDDQNASTGKEG